MSAAAVPLARAPHRSFFPPASPFHYFRSLSSRRRRRRRGGMTSFARSITFVLGGCRSALSLSLSFLPVVANAKPFLAMTCTVRTLGRMEGAFISAGCVMHGRIGVNAGKNSCLPFAITSTTSSC